MKSAARRNRGKTQKYKNYNSAAKRTNCYPASIFYEKHLFSCLSFSLPVAWLTGLLKPWLTDSQLFVNCKFQLSVPQLINPILVSELQTAWLNPWLTNFLTDWFTAWQTDSDWLNDRPKYSSARTLFICLGWVRVTLVRSHIYLLHLHRPSSYFAVFNLSSVP